MQAQIASGLVVQDTIANAIKEETDSEFRTLIKDHLRKLSTAPQMRSIVVQMIENSRDRLVDSLTREHEEAIVEAVRQCVDDALAQPKLRRHVTKAVEREIRAAIADEVSRAGRRIRNAIKEPGRGRKPSQGRKARRPR
jgi:hypothetical protein